MFLRRLLSIWIVISFSATLVMPPQSGYAQTILDLPEPGAMVSLSAAYTPVLIKGLKINPRNPLSLDFIVAIGNSQFKTQDPRLKIESEKLIKYFFAALTLPEKDVWVNLSPYEKDRIIPKATGETEMGRDMLAQDYILKQITASLIYPEKGLGKDFWNKIYTEAYRRFGTTQIPVNTFNKVWIVADKASVYEAKDTVFVVDTHLKVMLEEDYLATQKHQTPTHTFASQIVREIVLPALEKEVNGGKNFANLRQIFHSLILAKWYKETLKTALLNQVYSNKNKVSGLSYLNAKENMSSPNVPPLAGFRQRAVTFVGDPQYIYQQYLKAYKKGVFNYIKEDVDQITQQPLPRKYFSGGLQVEPQEIDHASIAQAQQALGQNKSAYVDFAITAKSTLSDAAMTADAIIPENFLKIFDEDIQFTGDPILTSLAARLAASHGLKSPERFKDLVIKKISGLYSIEKLARAILEASEIDAGRPGAADPLYGLKLFIAARTILYYEFNASDKFPISNDAVEPVLINELVEGDRVMPRVAALSITAADRNITPENALRMISSANQIENNLIGVYKQVSSVHKPAVNRVSTITLAPVPDVLTIIQNPKVKEVLKAEIDPLLVERLSHPEYQEYQRMVNDKIKKLYILDASSPRLALIWAALNGQLPMDQWKNFEKEILLNPSNPKDPLKDRGDRIARFTAFYNLLRQPTHLSHPVIVNLDDSLVARLKGIFSVQSSLSPETLRTSPYFSATIIDKFLEKREVNGQLDYWWKPYSLAVDNAFGAKPNEDTYANSSTISASAGSSTNKSKEFQINTQATPVLNLENFIKDPRGAFNEFVWAEGDLNDIWSMSVDPKEAGAIEQWKVKVQKVPAALRHKASAVFATVRAMANFGIPKNEEIVFKTHRFANFLSAKPINDEMLKLVRLTAIEQPAKRILGLIDSAMVAKVQLNGKPATVFYVNAILNAIKNDLYGNDDQIKPAQSKESGKPLEGWKVFHLINLEEKLPNKQFLGLGNDALAEMVSFVGAKHPELSFQQYKEGQDKKPLPYLVWQSNSHDTDLKVKQTALDWVSFKELEIARARQVDQAMSIQISGSAKFSEYQFDQDRKNPGDLLREVANYSGPEELQKATVVLNDRSKDNKSAWVEMLNSLSAKYDYFSLLENPTAQATAAHQEVLAKPEDEDALRRSNRLAWEILFPNTYPRKKVVQQEAKPVEAPKKEDLLMASLEGKTVQVGAYANGQIVPGQYYSYDATHVLRAIRILKAGLTNITTDKTPAIAKSFFVERAVILDPNNLLPEDTDEFIPLFISITGALVEGSSLELVPGELSEITAKNPAGIRIKGKGLNKLKLDLKALRPEINRLIKRLNVWETFLLYKQENFYIPFAPEMMEPALKMTPNQLEEALKKEAATAKSGAEKAAEAPVVSPVVPPIVVPPIVVPPIVVPPVVTTPPKEEVKPQKLQGISVLTIGQDVEVNNYRLKRKIKVSLQKNEEGRLVIGVDGKPAMPLNTNAVDLQGNPDAVQVAVAGGLVFIKDASDMRIYKLNELDQLVSAKSKGITDIMGLLKEGQTDFLVDDKENIISRVKKFAVVVNGSANLNVIPVEHEQNGMILPVWEIHKSVFGIDKANVDFALISEPVSPSELSIDSKPLLLLAQDPLRIPMAAGELDSILNISMPARKGVFRVVLSVKKEASYGKSNGLLRISVNGGGFVEIVEGMKYPVKTFDDKNVVEIQWTGSEAIIYPSSGGLALQLSNADFYFHRDFQDRGVQVSVEGRDGSVPSHVTVTVDAAMNATEAETVFKYRGTGDREYEARFIPGTTSPQAGKVTIHDLRAKRTYVVDDALPPVEFVFGQNGKTVVTMKDSTGIVQQAVYSGNRVSALRDNYLAIERKSGQSKKDAAMLNGGIDLNASKIDMQRQGEGIDIKFDSAMIAQFKMGNFDGIVPVITGITPIANIYPLLGLKEAEGNEKAAV